MRDAGALEQRGIPAVVLVTQPFAPIAQAQAKSLGFDRPRVAFIAHPLSGLDPASVRQRAEDVAPRVAEVLRGEFCP